MELYPVGPSILTQTNQSLNSAGILIMGRMAIIFNVFWFDSDGERITGLTLVDWITPSRVLVSTCGISNKV